MPQACWNRFFAKEDKYAYNLLFSVSSIIWTKGMRESCLGETYFNERTCQKKMIVDGY